MFFFGAENFILFGAGLVHLGNGTCSSTRHANTFWNWWCAGAFREGITFYVVVADWTVFPVRIIAILFFFSLIGNLLLLVRIG